MEIGEVLNKCRIENKNKLLEFSRFIVVGIIATIIHYSIYLSLLKLLETNISYFIGYILSLLFNYLLTSFFTFKRRPNYSHVIGFLFSHCINYFIHISLLNIYIYLGINREVAPILIYPIAILVNFVLLKRIFKRKNHEKDLNNDTCI